MCFCRGRTPQKVPHEGDESLAVSMEEPEGASTAEALGQDVLEQEPEEVGAGESASAARASVISITEGYRVIVGGDDVAFLKNAAIEVLAEIHECLFTAADMCAMNHPVLWQGLGDLELVFAQCTQPPGAEHLGKVVLVKEVRTPFLAPESSGGVERSSRDNEVDMRMKPQFPVMGVQNSMSPNSAAEFRIVQSERPQRLPGDLDQEVVADFLVIPDHRSQLSRECECDHEVVSGQEFFALTFEPAL